MRNAEFGIMLRCSENVPKTVGADFYIRSLKRIILYKRICCEFPPRLRKQFSEHLFDVNIKTDLFSSEYIL